MHDVVKSADTGGQNVPSQRHSDGEYEGSDINVQEVIEVEDNNNDEDDYEEDNYEDEADFEKTMQTTVAPSRSLVESKVNNTSEETFKANPNPRLKHEQSGDVSRAVEMHNSMTSKTTLVADKQLNSALMKNGPTIRV